MVSATHITTTIIFEKKVKKKNFTKEIKQKKNY